MATKKPLAQYSGKIKEISSSDTIPGTLVSELGLPLSGLTTTDKSNLIAAINEVFAKVSANYIVQNQKINSLAINFAGSII